MSETKRVIVIILVPCKKGTSRDDGLLQRNFANETFLLLAQNYIKHSVSEFIGVFVRTVE